MFEEIIPLAATKRQQSKLAKLQKIFKPSRKDNLADLQFLIYDFLLQKIKRLIKPIWKSWKR